MELLLYVVGIFIALVVASYLDAKGNKLLGIRARVDGYSLDPIDVVPIFAACLFWPFGLAVLTMVTFYRGMIWLFTREKAEPKMWRCRGIDEAIDYRCSPTPCDKRAKAVNAPVCSRHQMTMVEEE